MSKTWIVSVLTFIVGIILGAGAGTIIGVLHYGAKVSEHVRFFDEARLAKDGLKSFEAYQKEPPAIGIYALQRHLEELGTMQKRAGTNVVFLHGSDITWMQVLAHVRLSKLFAKVGELEKTTNEMKSAMTILPEVLWRDTPKSPDGVRAYVDGADKKGSWL